MNKALPAVVGILVIVVAGFYVLKGSGETTTTPPTQNATTGTTGNKASTPVTVITTSGNTTITQNGGENLPDTDGIGEGDADIQDKSAIELYKTADEALAAIKQASLTYDDVILEQFTNIGEDCSWCDSFYASVKGMMTSGEVNPEQRNFFAEVLAVSGKVENLKSLVEAIKSAPNQETAESFAQALELTVGKDEVVKFLGENFNSDNETLKEASIAAVTNQGSRLAVDLLHKVTSEQGDADGGYSKGIGLGELVPDEEAMPRLQELMNQRDKFSHLAVKSLLNSGAEGLKVVLDSLSSSKDPEFDKEMLKGAVDHVSWDEETMAVVDRALAANNSPVISEFANRIKEELKQSETGSSEEEIQAEESQPAATP